MWGEIEPTCAEATSVATTEVTPSRCEEVSQSNTCSSEPITGECPQSDEANEPHQSEHSDCLTNMIEVVNRSGCPVKSQQLGEPDLTMKERRLILREQYGTKPLVFLERYHAHLKPEHLDAFAHVSSDDRAQFYCKQVQKRARSQAHRTSVRNHRYAALRALQKEGQYFSEEQMRFREPLLYEQYIGQYLSEEEILQRSQEAMQRGTGGLADLLINSYQERMLQGRLQEQQEEEDCAQEEEEEDEEEEQHGQGDGGRGGLEWEPSDQEKAMLREEFLSQMHQRFLDGKDKDFNYSEVDDNPDYDNLDIVSRDAEERYFDNDEEEEEEEEDEEADMIQE